MANKTALYIRTLSVTLLAFIVLISACRTTTDPDPEPPIEPEPIERVGTKELTVAIIHRGTEAELTGYNIEIDGPVTASETNVSTAQFTLSNLASGEYTIMVSLNGFVDEEITEEFEVPEEVSADFLVESTISLRETTPPVKVNNNEDTTVQTGKADEEDAGEDEAVTLAIPANTFPANVVNEDGTVDISVTRARPSQVRRTADGLVRETITLRPVTDLNNTVNLTIPIREIEGLEDLQYVLQPGNIPLTRDGNGNLVATISPVTSSGGFGPTAEAGHIVSVGAPIADEFPQDRKRVQPDPSEGLELIESHTYTEYERIQGSCGGPLPGYVLEGVTIPGSVRSFLGRDLVKRLSDDRTVTFENLPNLEPRNNLRLSIEVSHRTTTYTTVRGPGQSVVHEVTTNRSDTRTRNAMTNPCHDSGGNTP